MACKIENLTMRPVLLTLATGQTLRLSPGEVSSELRELEVSNNPKIEKLRERGAIAVSDAGKAAAKKEEASASSDAEDKEGHSKPSKKK